MGEAACVQHTSLEVILVHRLYVTSLYEPMLRTASLITVEVYQERLDSQLPTGS